MIIIQYMNDNHSPNELKYIPRKLGVLLKDAVAYHPVVVLTGARKTGPTNTGPL